MVEDTVRRKYLLYYKQLKCGCINRTAPSLFSLVRGGLLSAIGGDNFGVCQREIVTHSSPLQSELHLTLQYVIGTSAEAMHTLENPNGSNVGVMIADFERLCSEERSFAVEVERTIQDIDKLAQRDVTRAEAELGAWGMECEAFRDRLQRAREGEYPFYHTLNRPLNLGYISFQGKKSTPTVLPRCWLVLKTGLTRMRQLHVLIQDLLYYPPLHLPTPALRQLRRTRMLSR